MNTTEPAPGPITMNDRELAAHVLGPGLEPLLAAEELTRGESRDPRYASYQAGSLICIGTYRRKSGAAYAEEGLISAIAAAIRDSMLTTLIQCVVRHQPAGDSIVCAFEDGRAVPLETARQVASGGYTALQGG